MLYLHVYFNDVFQEQVELKKKLFTIGRSDDNDLRIDNPGVSAHHAKIVQDGESYFVEDTRSTNGTSVNGEPVSRRQLEYGDKINIFKHTLRFSPFDMQVETGKQPRHNTGLADGSGTVEIDVSHLDKLLKQQPVSRAYLLVSGRNVKQRRRPLNSPVFKIGKDPESDLVIKGWFVPRTIASIERRGDGYYLVPGKSGKTRLNDNHIQHPTKLEDGDVFHIRRNEIRFIEQAEKVTG